MAERLPRILVIDDTPENLTILEAILAREFDVQIANSGPMGLALARELAPELILLDVMMPGMDGYETLHRLQSDPLTSTIPVIFVTSLTSPADETRGLESGAVDFISRPVNAAVARARIRTHLTVKRQADLLRTLAFIDGLTGIANRRRFDEILESEWRYCRRTRSPLTLEMIDIDQFKQFNDEYGHQAGDACLREIAGVLKGGTGRSHDLAARYGGEEFVCLLPETDMAGARTKAEELKLAVENLAIPHRKSCVAAIVTISIGAATVIPDAETGYATLLATADAQLYEAKRAGRNQVRCTETMKD
jgi:diguanylate cyclase (GGDEF)-like protein